MRRTKLARLDVVRCPECGICVDVEQLLMTRDLAIVAALQEELFGEQRPSRRVKELLRTLESRSMDLCTGLAYYGYETLADPEEEDE